MTDQSRSPAPDTRSDARKLREELLLAQLPPLDRSDMKKLLDAVHALPEGHRGTVQAAADSVLGNYVSRVRDLLLLTERLSTQAAAQERLINKLAQREGPQRGESPS